MFIKAISEFIDSLTKNVNEETRHLVEMNRAREHGRILERRIWLFEEVLGAAMMAAVVLLVFGALGFLFWQVV